MEINILIILLVVFILIILLFFYLKKNAKDKKSFAENLNQQNTEIDLQKNKEEQP
ncbi:hypothetical protein [Pedobacter psychrophilus]|uniref:hypothetical protein n=1 Tax=Pedobacter psychrophilus TaxID=1826909 RepID=UPI000AD06C9A|nr:hypothetical protein [Pedobacter psychrophilus]